MAIPDYQSLMRPLLACGQDGQEKNINDCIAKLAKQFELTDEERERLLPSGKQTIFANRVHWARTYLDKAGALRKTRRSHFEVTERGRQLLRDYPIESRLDSDSVRGVPSVHTSTTLADLFTPLRVTNPFSAVRASLRWWSSDEFENGLAHGRQGWVRRRPVASFFPALLF